MTLGRKFNVTMSLAAYPRPSGDSDTASRRGVDVDAPALMYCGARTTETGR